MNTREDDTSPVSRAVADFLGVRAAYAWGYVLTRTAGEMTLDVQFFVINHEGLTKQLANILFEDEDDYVSHIRNTDGSEKLRRGSIQKDGTVSYSEEDK